MQRRSREVLLAVALVVASDFMGATEMKEIPFAVGQRWEYRARPQDASSSLVIVKIDADPTHGNIVSISVSGLRLKNPRSPDGISDTAQHMPFAENALRKSVTKLRASHVPLPQFREGYDLWRSAFEAGPAGFYTISVAEAAQVMEDSLAHGR